MKIVKILRFLGCLAIITLLLGMSDNSGLADTIDTNNTKAIAQQESRLKKILISAKVPEYIFKIVKLYPHSTQHFTEGLIIQNHRLYESSGLYGQSVLNKIDISTGQSQQTYTLPKEYFAEGITIMGHLLYQLTYREHTGFVYDNNSFKLIQQFSIPTEGWGLTHNASSLILSNGSSNLFFIDPKTFKILRILPVRLRALAGTTEQSINFLNELEFIDGKIYANIWPTSFIIIISPKDGSVLGWMDIHRLKPSDNCSECVANGIAYDSQPHIIYLTGKNWPYLYAIKLCKKLRPAIL